MSDESNPALTSIFHQLTSAIRYIRSNIPLDELELRARYPPVDAMGGEKRRRGDAKGIAAAYGE